MCVGEVVEDVSHLLAVGMVADEYDRRMLRSVIVCVVMGLHTAAYRLQHEGVVFARHGHMSLGAQDWLTRRDFAEGGFDLLGILGLVGAQHKRLPAGIVAVKVFVGMFAVLMRGESAVGMAVELVLVVERRIGFRRHLVQRTVVVVAVPVRMIMGGRGRSVVQVHPHAEAGVELRVVCQF